MRILIADDSPTMRKVFRGLLSEMGHAAPDLLEASDGSEAARLLAQARPEIDLVVADWDLPGMDGLMFLKYLQTAGLSRGISFLFCINRTQRSFTAQVTEQVRCEFIERPFVDETFRAAIRILEEGVATRKTKEGSEVLHTIVSTVEADENLPFLLRLPSHLIEEFLQLATSSKHPAGTTLFRAGDAVDCLHVVTFGEVELVDAAPGSAPRICREGDCFGEISFMTGAPSRVMAGARTAVQVASLSRIRLGELVRHQPGMSAHLSGLIARDSKGLNRSPVTRVDSELTGTFQSMSFADLIQLLLAAQKSGVLGFREGNRSGGIYLEGGEALHAWVDDLTGEEAFHRLASWSRAKFAFNSISRREERTIHQPTMSLLMEAMRKVDEGSRAAEAPVGGQAA